MAPAARWPLSAAGRDRFVGASPHLANSARNSREGSTSAMYWSTGDDVQTESTGDHSHEQNRRLVQPDAARAPTGRRIPVLAVPVIAGSGERLYDGIDTTGFDLIDVKQLDNGILGLTYVPTTTR